MRITPQQYAQSLYGATKDKSQSEVDSILTNFTKVLSKNNHLKFKKKIIDKFREIYNRENGIIEAEVTSREALNDNVRAEVSNKVSIKYGAKRVILAEKIDASIKGGIILRVGDEVMDGSVKRQLEMLKNNLSK